MLERGSVLGAFPALLSRGDTGPAGTHNNPCRRLIARLSRLLLDGREQAFIDDAIDTLKLSGYLYQPERRMRVLMSLFTLRTEYLRRYVSDIFRHHTRPSCPAPVCHALQQGIHRDARHLHQQ